MIFFEPNVFVRRSLVEYKDWKQFIQTLYHKDFNLNDTKSFLLLN